MAVDEPTLDALDAGKVGLEVDGTLDVDGKELADDEESL